VFFLDFYLYRTNQDQDLVVSSDDNFRVADHPPGSVLSRESRFGVHLSRVLL
jgi:hypothetical protein